ncbi:glycerol kinase GlpK [Paenibacillus chartarius]|uniref:ATP:glycerol 3-phosphotransferase n=1 Tax=Paenibacillus chartarius TaxID=747481 RepID=A0ABV6DLU7_9BACL
MGKGYIVTVDQSTSGTKALVVDCSGAVVGRSSAEHRQIYPCAGWAEHDPLEIYDNVKLTVRRALESAGIDDSQIAVLTVTNQRETAVMWDRTTGLPVYPAIVWQCQRTADACAALQEKGYGELVRAKTGLMLDPYFSAAKWTWIIDHVPGVREKLEAGELLAGTIDCWLLWKLTGGAVHATDCTNASRTSLFNIHSLQWDDELCRLFQVPQQLLPEVKSSDEIFGYTNEPDLFEGRKVPISGVIGDSQAALFGNRCFRTGMAKATFGTGTSVLMNVGNHPVDGGTGLVSAIAWGIGGTTTYALEAVIRSSGDCLKWVRDNLGLFTTFDQLEEMLEQVKEPDGVYLVPAFVGLGAPYWDPYARAAIVGMNRGTSKAHIVRAAVESIAYQVRDAVEFMQTESGVRLEELCADGGAATNGILMQFQADMLDCPIVQPVIAELSAMGSVYIGGLGVGFWTSQDEIAALPRSYRKFEPDMSPELRAMKYAGWRRAVTTILQS